MEEPLPPRVQASRPCDAHTYGAKCRLAPVPVPNSSSWLDGIPPICAQFFYSSPMSIDDPLSANTTDAKTLGFLLRPFSLGDNNALERAWLSLSSDDESQNHLVSWKGLSPDHSLRQANERKMGIIARELAERHLKKHSQQAMGGQGATVTPHTTLQGSGLSSPTVCCEQLSLDAAAELADVFCPLARTHQAALHVDKLVQKVITLLGSYNTTMATINGPASLRLTLQSVASSSTSRHDLPFPHRFDLLSPSPSVVAPDLQDRSPRTNCGSDQDCQPRQGNIGVHAYPYQRSSQSEEIPTSTKFSAAALAVPAHLATLEDDMSKKSFLRADTPRAFRASVFASVFASSPTKVDSFSYMSATINGEPSPRLVQPPSPTISTRPAAGKSDEVEAHIEIPTASETEQLAHVTSSLKAASEVTVGLSRLHMVDLPALHMRPVYWSPVNDVAVVQRSTWFYRDTMLPVQAVVANQLESLYRELRPWSETWADELRCAINVGPLGEEKISQPLWPGPLRHSKKMKHKIEPAVSSAPFCASRCLHGAAAAEGTLEDYVNEEPSDANFSAATKYFANHHVVFRNGTTAFLLKPSLKPSAYYNRRPVAKICKGVTIGIPVVRGYNRSSWNEIHQPSSGSTLSSSRNSSTVRVAPTMGDDNDASDCPGCLADVKLSQVSDLILVIHGVGQKLAERVESFHFTHAINGFRRAINAELANPAVQSALRQGQNGIMVLPLNWRHSLTFEEGGLALRSGEGALISASDRFGLKDIEPKSIPAVRSMISDVMFDIPFYMSHHKPKMIQALVREANRVYRLWCHNNPGFAEKGRVHLIGHSLGSAMAMEVLSKQPTVPPPQDLTKSVCEVDYLEFDTKNLFLLGSPSAFFLLLERATLVPRRDRQKPEIDADDSLDSRVVGDAGLFGCLAVDNIFNILAKEDPIAYLLNGTIDTAYAASLETAHVPPASVSLFESISQSLRGVVPSMSVVSQTADTPLSKTATSATSNVRLPSQLELEVHDFTREELAERKAYLLNDNGQIDYFLHSRGGPLEIQYLNMLSAHTSYWTNQDLIRMLCLEVGRQPGKANTLLAMRAVKKPKRVLPSTD